MTTLATSATKRPIINVSATGAMAISNPVDLSGQSDIGIEAHGTLTVRNPVALAGQPVVAIAATGAMAISNPVSFADARPATAKVEAIGVMVIGQPALAGYLAPEPVSTVAVMVANANTMAHTTYTGMALHGLSLFRVARVACLPDGLYVLRGDNDAGTPILAALEWPPSDLGTPNNKVADHVVATLRGGGRSSLTAKLARKDKRVATLGAASTVGAAERRLARFTRALRGRFWQFGFENNGADFELMDVDVNPTVED